MEESSGGAMARTRGVQTVDATRSDQVPSPCRKSLSADRPYADDKVTAPANAGVGKGGLRSRFVR